MPQWDQGARQEACQPAPQQLEHNIHYAKSWIGRIRAFVSSAWQWLGLWLGSCLRPQTPAKDEIAA